MQIKRTRSEVAKLGGIAKGKNFFIFKKCSFELYQKGLTQQEIANQLNISQKTVSKYLSEYCQSQLRKRTRNKMISEAVNLEALQKERTSSFLKNNSFELYQKGLTQQEIANELNISQSTVSKYLSEYSQSKSKKSKRKNNKKNNKGD